ncbi:uncharacterized protein LOC141905245 [Tubulanus polymorphus]|uniref:uncharacterized protein LOC141905245 n=1 Tax=Tubulanus polymorphus TaxID=672921 RepID=UPI003DA44143
MADMQVHVLENSTKRTTKRGEEFLYALGITASNKRADIYCYKIGEAVSAKLTAGNYIKIKGHKAKEEDDIFNITVGTSAKIFYSSKFKVEQDRIDSIMNPPICSVLDALSAPKRRRISVSAKVEKVIQSPGKRTDVHLSDDNNNKLVAKFWNGIEVSAGSRVTVKRMEVNIYNNKTEIQSTPTTTLEVEKCKDNHGTLTDIDDEDHTVIIDKKLLKYHTKLEADILALQFDLPRDVMYTCEGDMITEIDLTQL